MLGKIRQALENVLQRPLEGFTEETDIIGEIGLDSLQMIQFVMALEENCGITFDYDEFDIEHLQSVKRLAEYIGRQKRLSPEYV